MNESAATVLRHESLSLPPGQPVIQHVLVISGSETEIRHVIIYTCVVLLDAPKLFAIAVDHFMFMVPLVRGRAVPSLQGTPCPSIPHSVMFHAR